jgi:hypothetical protein
MSSYPQLDLFTPRGYQNELFGSEYITLRAAEVGNGPIDFFLNDNKDYIDLSESYLSLRLKVLNADDKPIVGDGKDNVALINNAMHSVFSDIKVILNQVLVNSIDGYYGYQSLIQAILRYSVNVQDKQLFISGFARDDYRAMDTVANSGFLTRKAWTGAGASKTFYGKLNCPMFQQERLLIPGADLNVRLDRAKDSFALFCKVEGLKPKVVFEEALLHLLTIKLHPDVMARHTARLSQGLPVLYEQNNVEFDAIPVSQGELGCVRDSLFYGRVPKYLVMVMVGTIAFYGNYGLNPYNFKHYDIKSLLLTRDGEKVPYDTFEPDFKNGDCLREYIALYQSNDLLGKNAALPISLDEFKSGYTNFQWNLSDDGMGLTNGPDTRAKLTLKIQFHEKLPEPVMILFYGIFNSTVSLFGNKHVQVDNV